MARRPQRTKKAGHSVSTSQKGINLVETLVLNMGFVWNPTYQNSGIDSHPALSHVGLYDTVVARE